jgi:hypothetical protein
VGSLFHWLFGPPPDHHPDGSMTVPLVTALALKEEDEDPSVVHPRYSIMTQYQEVRVREFRLGDSPTLFFFNIPTGVEQGDIIQVDLDGRKFDVRISGNVKPGERVILVAPAPVH